MSRGNKEIRFRASDEFHSLLTNLQDELGTQDKSASAKLLISLGNERIKDVVNYIDNITTPLSNTQFEDMFLSIKIRIIEKRKERIKIKAL